MIGIVAVLKVQDGKGPEFEKVFLDLTAKVRANEPGNLLYQLTRSRADPDTYKVLELYRDQDALTAHGGSGIFQGSRSQDGRLHGRASRDRIPRRGRIARRETGFDARPPRSAP